MLLDCFYSARVRTVETNLVRLVGLIYLDWSSESVWRVGLIGLDCLVCSVYWSVGRFGGLFGLVVVFVYGFQIGLCRFMSMVCLMFPRTS